MESMKKLKWVCIGCSVPCKFIEKCNEFDYKNAISEPPKLCPHGIDGVEWKLVT